MGSAASLGTAASVFTRGWAAGTETLWQKHAAQLGVGMQKQGTVDNIKQVITAYYLVELCTRNIKKIDRNS